MSIPHAGELAALGTAACWTATALSFEAAGRRIGSLTVNLLRLVLAIFLLAAAGWAFRGRPFPTDATSHAWLWLTVSGLVGFTFGDLCLFRAFVVLGSRLSTLMMSLAPPLTALIGWAVLGEVLGGRDLAGMGLTIAGIAWAVFESSRRAPGGPLPPSSDPAVDPGGGLEADEGRVRAADRRAGPRPAPSPRAARRSADPPPRLSPAGVALGFGGALGQAGGLVLSKLGMGDYNPFAATQIRVLAGTAGYVLLFFALGRWGRVARAFADRRALAHTAVGAVFGPFLGVSLSLLAVQHTLTGVAASIMAITPILIIPVVVLIGRERVGPGGWAGAVVAVAGVVLLFL
jgi:drug/metabolite transporter (DMT)-like permease